MVRDCRTRAKLKQVLNCLPKTLEDTYDRILSDIPDIYENEMQNFLACLAYSARPLTLEEIAETFVFNRDSRSICVD
jgi:hypothetical protein